MKERCLCSGRYLANWKPPICWECKHYRANATCTAFAHGIPYQILMSEADHRQPFPGDHGICFEASVLKQISAMEESR